MLEFATQTEAPADELTSALPDLDRQGLEELLYNWEVWARDDQLPPLDTHWRTWLILGGRGAGKTRAGAEWVRAQALGRAPFADRPATRIALVAETHHDARAVMVEGISGILAVHAPGERPEFYASRGELVWPNGAIAQIFSAEDPDALRGPQFDAAWCDEIAKWRRAEAAWDMLQFALRLGDNPRAVATTTPRRNALLERLLADDRVAVSRATTYDNRTHLAPAFIDEMERRYHGSALGRQELEGELIDDARATLWQAAWIEETRVTGAPQLGRIVIGVDPPVSSGENADACGIVAAGIAADAHAYVLADRTIQGEPPNVWARRVLEAYRDFGADRIVAEVNQGGDLVETVIRQIDPAAPITKVRATRGKWVRAEPVAALYAERRVAHVGRLEALEDELLSFSGDGTVRGRSPDRLDALVWALTDLMTTPEPSPRLRVL